MNDNLKANGKEFECNQSVDRLEEVECWVHNISCWDAINWHE
jgi:hypothetical protein